MKRIGLLVLFMAGCSFTPQPKSYVAVAMATDIGQGAVKKVTLFGTHQEEVVWISMKTPKETYFTVTFRASSPMRFPANRLGELRYHQCGENLYCFDSFTAK